MAIGRRKLIDDCHRKVAHDPFEEAKLASTAAANRRGIQGYQTILAGSGPTHGLRGGKLSEYGQVLERRKRARHGDVHVDGPQVHPIVWLL